jgi:putative ABC transport system permease protein
MAVPDWKQLVRSQLAPLRLPPERELEIAEELALHLEALYEDALAEGLPSAEAQARAVQNYDWRLLECELSRAEQPLTTRALRQPIQFIERRGGMRMESLWQDLRFGARMLRKQPGFTFVAVLTLALGIGATTAIFSVVSAVLLRPLPFAQPERLVRLWESHPPTQLPQFSVAFPNFLDWRQQNQVFTHLAAFREDGFNLQTGEEPHRVNGARVTVDFFNVLGMQPAQGRAFSAAEDTPGGERVVIVSHALWQQTFGGDPHLLGRQLKLDGQAHTVVGVMPPGFRYPNEQAELWLPYALDAAQTGRGPHFLRVLGRLKDDATLEQARSEFETIALRLEQAYPDSNKGWRVVMLPLQESISGELETPLYVLLGAVLFVLLIACANIANLLLARNAARERELAIRAALGAGRGRLVRQLVVESMLLALAGGAGALLVASWGVKLLTTLGPRDIPRLQEAALDAPVLGFTLFVSVLTGLIFGLAPAWQRARQNPHAALKDGARTAGSAGQRLRQALVVTEVARAGLTAELNLPTTKYAKAEQRAAFLQQVLERLRALPGVEFAGATHRLPLRGNSGNSFQIEGRPAPASGQRLTVNYRAISPDYFRALGVPLVAGRSFTEEEVWQKPSAIIINQALARRHWPTTSPLGKRLKFGAPTNPWLEIVGIAADTKDNGLETEAGGCLYVPYVMMPAPAMTLVLRTQAKPLGLAAAVSAAVRRVDAEQAVSNINTLAGLLDGTVAQPRFNALLLALFALLALVLAAVGIYGVIAYAVAQRTPEIGLRMALGAQPRDVLRLVLGQGMRLVLLGLALGLGAALALTRLLQSLLFGVSATDPLTFALTALLILLAAFLACYVPARRALRVDPLVALRYE